MATYDHLTASSVSVLDQAKGLNWRRAYINSEAGRTELETDYPDIYAGLCGEGNLWGTEPAVATEEIAEPATPSLEERVNDLEQTVDTMLTGGDAT